MNLNHKLQAPLFIVGHPRSGTTLIAAALGRHPHFAATPETHFFNEVRHALAPLLSGGPDVVAQRIATTRMRHFGLSAPEIATALRDVPPTESETFNALLGAFLAKADKRRIVEKTPVHIRHIDEIMAWWPDSRVLWILRDGRACVSSLLKVTWAAGDPTVLARQWNRNVAFALAAEKRYGDRMLRVRYERLVLEPTSEMTRVLAWLGEDFAPETLDPTRGTEIIAAPETWKGNVLNAMEPGRSEAWREELTPEQIGAAEAVMAPLLRQTGYSVAPADTSARAGERLRHSLVNGSIGRATQKWVYHRVAARRYAPWGANQADKSRR